jgi:hypothetical protein
MNSSGQATDRPFGPRYAQALGDATLWHQEQTRKGSTIPYVSHLLHVSALVLEDGGDEDEAIAGLLHDAVEDAGVTAELLAERYGDRVADIVMACTDDTGGDREKKAPWWERKVTHIGHVVSAVEGGSLDVGIARVAAADKLANMRSTLDEGDHAVFERFKAGLGGFAWYHAEFGGLLVEYLHRTSPRTDGSLLASRLQMALDQMEGFVAARRAELGNTLVAVEERLAVLRPADGSRDPWPWFALDVVHRSGGWPSTETLLVRWASWFDRPLPADPQGRSALMDVLQARSDVRRLLQSLAPPR